GPIASAHPTSMSDNAVVWSSALDLAARIRQKDVSPVEVTEAILGRIAALNPRLNAFCLVAADQARAAALDAEVAVMKHEPLGPLHGVPARSKAGSFRAGSAPPPARRCSQAPCRSPAPLPVARLR